MVSRIQFPAFVLAALYITAAAFAQEESVKPGINDNFRDPSIKRYTMMFEGESRAIFKHRVEIVDALQLEDGMAVADIGAGTGFFSVMIADRVGDGGLVYSVDIAENFIEHITKRAEEEDLSNIRGVLCDPHSTKLDSESVDLVFVCDTYHHFEYPYDTLSSIHQALRPEGRLVIVDFERVKGVNSEWTLDHVRCGKGTVTDEVKDAGFDFVEEIKMMDEQYVIVFKKRTSPEE
jgi:ubiquinone/menaquinone biosynthesis C-methylase UbiE